jgi:hypothetical protein
MELGDRVLGADGDDETDFLASRARLIVPRQV